jgi:hypothetical protein
MAQVLIEYDNPLKDRTGRTYTARVCGRLMDDYHRWEGWIEFEPDDDSPVLRTARETVQPNLHTIQYWATGLTAAYLEGALARALGPQRGVRTRDVEAQPTYDAPAPASPSPSSAAAPLPAAAHSHAVIDPFHVLEQGEDVLRRELSALDASHLRNVIRAHRLVDEDQLDLSKLGRAALAELIVAAVTKRVAAPAA